MAQGLTEFLPISSSGHLVIIEKFMDIDFGGKVMMGFDIILHAGTLAALILLYWATLWKLIKSVFRGGGYRRLLLALIIATVPAVIAGTVFADAIGESFRSEKTVGLGFISTALILVLGEKLAKNGKENSIRYKSAFLIGCAQAVALLPGVSRSGLTISAGQSSGLSRSSALDFSFLMAIPAIAGAALLAIKEFYSGETIMPDISILSAGLFSSFAFSAIAIMLLRRLISKISFGWFAVYLIPVGVLLLV